MGHGGILNLASRHIPQIMQIAMRADCFQSKDNGACGLCGGGGGGDGFRSWVVTV